MISPPTYIRLTSYEDGAQITTLVSLIHSVDEDPKGFSVLSTFHGTDRGVLVQSVRVKESEREIMAKIKKVIKAYHLMIAKCMKHHIIDADETWKHGDDDDFDDDISRDDDPLNDSTDDGFDDSGIVA